MQDAEKIARRIEVTRDARFFAHARLRRRQKFSFYVVSMISLIVITLSLFQNFLTLKDYQSQILLSATIVLSVFIIILSLTEGFENFQHQAEQYFNSARKLAGLLSKMEALDGDDAEYKEMLRKVLSEYEKIEDDASINHTRGDYLRVRSEKPNLFPRKYPIPRRLNLIGQSIDRIASFLDEFSWILFPSSVVLIAAAVVFQFVILKSEMGTPAAPAINRPSIKERPANTNESSKVAK